MWGKGKGVCEYVSGGKGRQMKIKRHAQFKIGLMLNVAVAGIFIIAAVITVVLVRGNMRQQALAEAESKARITLERNLAIHTYFTHNLKPKLFELTGPLTSKDYFEPSWMSSTYAIREIDKYFKSLNPEGYYYKDAAINARSPDNEAAEYEREFLEELKKDQKLEKSSGIRMIDGKPYLVIMRRGEVMESSCLRCHSSPANAPGDMVKSYGSERSFNRHAGDVVSTVSMRIPLSEAYANADRFTIKLSILLLLVLCVLFTFQYFIYNRLLIEPLGRIREKALKIKRDKEGLGEKIPEIAGKELNDLATAFNDMSTSLKNNMDNLQETINGSVFALAKAGEFMGLYTEGHPERVANLAAAIARELDLSDDQIRGIRVMGLLHDIGKIVVPREILSKLTILSDREWGIIREHPKAGSDILEKISFPWPVAEAVLHHHERVDGSGYPSHLKGSDISLEAKILSVSEVVESIASHQLYRPGHGAEAALEEIGRNKGILYDAEIVDACLRLFWEKGYKIECGSG